MTGPRLLGRAAVIAVGSELLTASRPETNSLIIAELLNGLGIELARKTVVGDRPEDIAGVFREALAHDDLIIVTGGLGPTDDDLTRQVVAEVLGLPLAEDAAIVERIAARFARRGMPMPAINRRQALVPAGAVVLDNPRGTAPGLWIEADDGVVVLLPGPPRELRPMLEALAESRLAPRTGGIRLFRKVVSVAGRTESYVDDRVRGLYPLWRERTPAVAATILASLGHVELHLSARAADESLGRAAVQDAVSEIIDRLGEDVFSVESERLEEIVGRQLTGRGWRLAVAESCTGGGFASRLTSVAGSSAYFERGFVTYSNQSKADLLGVPADLIAAHGAVSEPVARAMAEGARRAGGADLGLSITGIAGPGGGSEAKPVGTVVFAIDGPGSGQLVRTHNFPGDRTQVRAMSVQYALDALRRVLLRVGAGPGP